MASEFCLSIAMFIYAVSAICFVLYSGSKARQFEIAGNYAALGAFLVLTLGVILRWREPSGLVRVYTTNGILYAVLILFVWALTVYFIVFVSKDKFRGTGMFILPFALAGMMWTQLNKEFDVAPDWPRMMSNWPVYYVFTSAVAYASFSAAGSVSFMNIISRKREHTGENKTGIVATFPAEEVLNVQNRKKNQRRLHLPYLKSDRRGALVEFRLGSLLDLVST